VVTSDIETTLVVRRGAGQFHVEALAPEVAVIAGTTTPSLNVKVDDEI